MEYLDSRQNKYKSEYKKNKIPKVKNILLKLENFFEIIKEIDIKVTKEFKVLIRRVRRRCFEL